MFDHEKLDVYQLELKFLAWATEFLVELSDFPSPVNKRELTDQLDRASLSALLNTAEGNGRRQGKQRAKFFDDVRGSAIESAACLDASVAKKLSSVDRIQSGKEMLVRIVSMLSKLVERSIRTCIACGKMKTRWVTPNLSRTRMTTRTRTK
jgi:four helix bundle protein